ncbi:hypothetical protein [Cupriavidus sp. TMH.W2]|uniref:hypothetical protein n=1 Tax=Cupriavidus sp. TMH.W2 TaxID=3434465 RepID=UPI003D786DC6
MHITDARSFLDRFAERFESTEVQAWHWEADDNDFGKRTSWQVGDGMATEVTAAVELMAGELTLRVTERQLDADDSDSEATFEARVSFDDRTVTIDGATLPYDEPSIAAVIDRFNEVA